MDTTRFVLGVLLIVGLPPAITYWLLIHPFVGFWRRVGTAGTLVVVGLVCISVGVGMYRFRHPLLGPDLGTNWVLVGTGVGFYLASAWISVLTKRHLTAAILSGLPELSDSPSGGTLLQEGVYGVVRHPRYLSVIIGTAGFSMVVNYVGAYLMVLATIPALYLVAVLEERELESRFGSDYLQYRSRVPAVLPWKGRGGRRG